MSNEWKMVPVDPTEEMIYAIATRAHCGDSGKDIWSEALAYAPVPPAGDVRVMRYGFRSEYVSVLPDELDRLEIHVTLLTAELTESRRQVQLLNEAGEFLDDVSQGVEDKLREENAALQSELTKAREALKLIEDHSDDEVARNVAYEAGTKQMLGQSATSLAHQSAPAAKGGE